MRASYDEIPKATQDEFFAGTRDFVKENKGRYECGGYIYSGEGQELGQFWATYGAFADKDCTKLLATLMTDENGNTERQSERRQSTVPYTVGTAKKIGLLYRFSL